MLRSSSALLLCVPAAPRATAFGTDICDTACVGCGGTSLGRSGTWSEPACEGHMAAGRSGHAGAVLDGCWYLAGGGDCKRALTDTLVLELRAPSGAR